MNDAKEIVEALNGIARAIYFIAIIVSIVTLSLVLSLRGRR